MHEAETKSCRRDHKNCAHYSHGIQLPEIELPPCGGRSNVPKGPSLLLMLTPCQQQGVGKNRARCTAAIHCGKLPSGVGCLRLSRVSLGYGGSGHQAA